MSTAAQANVARVLNLVLPGGGLVLVHRPWTGVSIGLLFTVLANLAVWATLLVPDDFAPWLRGVLIGVAGGTYVGAQIRLGATLRSERSEAQTRLRQQALQNVRYYLDRGEADAALAALDPVAELVADDLLLAYRLAQVLTCAGQSQSALAAWDRVRELDRHRIYRDELETALRSLRTAIATPARPTSAPRNPA